MKLKLTKRERVLIIVAAVCLVAVGLYYLVIKPPLDLVFALEQKAEGYNQVINEMKEKASPDHPIYSDYKILNAKTQNLLQRYYPTIIQEKIILMLDEKIKKSNLRVTTISFVEPALSEIIQDLPDTAGPKNELQELVDQINKGTVAPDQPAANTQPESITLPFVEKMSSVITFEGSYDEIYNFIQAIEQEGRSIVCSEINIISNFVDHLTGTMTLDFYAVPKPMFQDEAYMRWDRTGTYGKSNPFGFLDGIVPVENIESGVPQGTPINSENSVDKRDFFIFVRSVSSDLPTITMGRYLDITRETYVYSDNLDYGKAELHILQDGEKYYYKYKTQLDSYPSDFNTEMIEFTPVGEELSLLVMSNKRVNENDVSGVSLTVVNNSDLPMNILVKNDDKKLPRFKIERVEGIVTVKNQ